MDIPLVYLLTGISVVSPFWSLFIVMIWTLIYKFSCGHELLILLGMYRGEQLLHQMIIAYFTLWGTAELFPQCLHHFTFSPAMNEGFRFFVIFINTCYCLFDYSHSSAWKVVSRFYFDLYFPRNKSFWESFHMLLAMFILSLEKCLVNHLPRF